MAQNGREKVAVGRTRSIEAGERTVTVEEEAECWKHAVDGRDQRGRRSLGLRGVGLAQRQQVGEQVEDSLGVARDVTAVGEDLDFDLAGKLAAGPGETRRTGRQGKGGEGQGDADRQARPAGRDVRGRRGEVAHLQRQRAEECTVEG